LTHFNAHEQISIMDYAKTYARSIADPEVFWADAAASLHWEKRWERVLDASQKPFYKWFTGARTNIVQNAVDRHARGARAQKPAFLWEGEPGDRRTLTYAELDREVCKLANLLKARGVKPGEVVTIYMPQIPELPIAMLATAKIGALHSVVYGGFSTEALQSRIEDAKSRVVLTADGGHRRGKITDLKSIVDGALDRSPDVHTCVVVRRTAHAVQMRAGRDIWMHEALATMSTECPTEIRDAEDPLFILYTSGSTGKPKGLLHTHGGYSVYASFTHRTVFDLREDDIYWCTADPGWITGHSYLVYGPLINGATVVMYEGAPNHPSPARWWEICERYGVTLFYTSPTGIRGLMRFGEEWPRKHDLSKLRILGSVGEPINPEAWRWYHKYVGGERCPIMDTWWQTETGGFMITPQPGMALKPGSAMKPFYGVRVAVVDDAGTPVAAGQEGNLVLQSPWPGMARTIWGDPDRYRETYWKAYEKQGWYKAGDAARIDADGDVWVIGRTDDVIKVSGYRLGTAEIESTLVSHPAVAEAAAIGLPHEIKGNSIHAFALLRSGHAPSPELAEKLREHVAHALGPIARPEAVTIVDQLPKTRSGKIMRRVLRARALGQDVGDLTTLEE
jgi:acetyl-CoA synthetase